MTARTHQGIVCPVLAAIPLHATAARLRPNRVLQGGHDACFLGEHVEKRTDNKASRCFAATTDAHLRSERQWRSVVIGSGAFPSRAGADGYFDARAGVEHGHEWLR